MITISISGVDRTQIIEFGSVQKVDAINRQTDTLNFVIIYHPGQTFRPETNTEVVMYDGATKVFGGKIYAISKESQGDGSVKYSVKCKDYSYDLSALVVEEYTNMTLAAIIADIIDNYAPTFTYANVSSDLLVSKMIFDRISIVECLNRLSDLSSYSWYVDYDKDIHFFEKNTEPSPFNLTDNNGNYITDSLQVTDDFSQIRNRVFIKGGEIEGTSRTELFNGDGTKKQFKLSNKFSHKPTVTVGGVSKTVGTDYISNDADFDCFWDYNQQYVRFKDTTIPASGTSNISVTGTPLYNLVVQVEEPISIAQYGVFEFAKTDKTIKSREAAVAMAKAQILAYKDGLIQGGFETYTPGLKSGQIISINSTLLDINEDFLIQRVNFKMISINQGYWKVDLATLKSTSIIDFLIGMLKSGDHVIEDIGDATIEKTVFPSESFYVNDAIGINTDDYPQSEEFDVLEAVDVQDLDYDVEFCVGLQLPSGTKRQFIMNNSTLG